MNKNNLTALFPQLTIPLCFTLFCGSSLADTVLSSPCNAINDTDFFDGLLTSGAWIGSSNLWYSGERVMFTMAEPVEGEPETISLVIKKDDEAQQEVVDEVQFQGTVSFTIPEVGYFSEVGVAVNYPLYNAKATITEAVCEQTGLGKSFPLNAGFDDAWYDPSLSGQGFSIVVFPSIKSVFLAMYTFDTERPNEDFHPIVGDAGHRWLTAFGPYEGGVADLSIEVTTGGILLEEEPAPVWSEGGTMTLRAVNCRLIEIDFAISSIGQQGTLTLERVVEDRVRECEGLAVGDGE